MAKSKKSRKNNRHQKKKFNQPEKPFKYPILTARLRRWIIAVLIMLFGAIISFSFFGGAGIAGKLIFNSFDFLIGKTTFFIPLLFFLVAFLIIKPQKKRIFAPIFLGAFILIIGISGILTVENIVKNNGGLLGYIVSWPLLNYFGLPVSLIVFSILILIGALILWEFVPKKKIFPAKKQIPLSKETSLKEKPKEGKPKFEIKPVEIPQRRNVTRQPSYFQAGSSQAEKGVQFPEEITREYKNPPLKLLDLSEEKPQSGDTNYNSLVIKKTLENFGIEVEMSEVNIGPTVTQYTLKPAEGIKLSKITSLNNDLALSLASHPIRIEAPIPGRSLVGIEVPNKIRAKVKIGNLLSSESFQKLSFPLSFALGRDVMGEPVFVDLERMPHLLVAGATGSGKTICLNSLITSLIYRNSPRILKLILIDPKRVEFPIYNSLPHLLTPVIFKAKKAVNVLNWLVGEMERRFEVLGEAGQRDIASYNNALNQKKSKLREDDFEMMPYIVLIIDELADLMASKGREVEAGIVRLSQLARAVGIHLVVATQRPSVEVITGLIKANITSRVAFQVASQVDSRTILDMSGAEKLLGRGDMLFLSSEFSKPKRIQGSFISSGEIKKVVNFIKKENTREEGEIAESIEREIKEPEGKGIATVFEEDPLYEEAKKTVREYQRASASLLQRRLKIGYARAARILDMLEQKGVVGPADGAKPRKVYQDEIQNSKFKIQNSGQDDDWQKL